MQKPRYHVFVCRRYRDPAEGKPSCEAGNSQAFYEALYQEIEKRGLRDVVQLTKTHCLGQCEQGPTAVVYPDGVWYGHLRPEDAVKLVEDHLLGGKPMKRKMI